MVKHCLAMAIGAAFATSASAGFTYNFGAITNNNAGDVAIGESQFFVEVNDAGANKIEFLFTNTGPSAASMVQIYWDDIDGVLNALTGWSTTTPTKGAPNFGVDFSGGSANPGNLPAGNPAGFFADFSIQAQTKKGKSKNGVGAGEDLSVFFSTSESYANVINAMNTGGLSIGIHGQAFSSGGSESFVNHKMTGVPSPTAAIAGLAMLGIAAARRRRRA